MNPLDELLGQSPAIEVVRKQVQQMLALAQSARRLPPILLQGETGTGKGLLARLLHRYGPRREAPFVDVSCAAIPENLLEAELFGFERGAFTDARHAKPGLLQAAHRGTIFLDELALLPQTFQAKLLKAIEEKAVRRLGSTHAEVIDVQIVSASNEDLATAVRERRFRDDLYHRLAVVTFTLPALRARSEDILVLAEHFLSRACTEYGLSPPRHFAADARVALQAYAWPGNVRELSNVIERAVLLAESTAITAVELRLPERRLADIGWSRFDDQLENVEREQLLGALQDTNWNVSRAAVALGISRGRLRYQMEKHRLNANRVRGVRTPQSAVGSPQSPVGARSINAEQRHLGLLRVELAPRSEDLRASEFTAELNDAKDKIRTYGGRVTQPGEKVVIGTFGLDTSENAAASAALAALAIKQASRRELLLEPSRAAPKLAVHAGTVTLEQREGQVAVSPNDAASLDNAMEALSNQADAESILVSGPAAAFLERRFELEQTRHATSLSYRLLGLEATGFGLGGRALTKLIGREHEFETVWHQLAHAQRRQGQIIAVVGGPGVGKSRFIYELTRVQQTAAWRTLICRAAPHAVNVPFLPLSELLKSYFDIEDRDDVESVRRKVSDQLRARSHPFDQLEAPLLAVLGISVDDDHWQHLEPPQKRRRTMEACRRLLLQESEERPLLLLFEDLHWLDSETQSFLDSLIDSLSASRLLLVVSYRPEYKHDWAAKTYYTQIRIDPLPNESAAAMLQTLLGDDASLDSVKQRLIERTEGNPLFLEESVRGLVESGSLDGRAGAYRLVGPSVEPEIPATVQAILAARIDRLGERERRLLRAAAVIGKDVSCAILQKVAGLPAEALRQSLSALQAAELLYEKHAFPDTEFTFKHALTYEAAYESVPALERKQLHAAIMAAIAEVHSERLTEHVEQLARHALRAELWEQALVYLRQASEKAISRSANREAWAHLEQAVAALRHLPETRTNLEQSVDLRLAARTSLSPLGEFGRALEMGLEAVPIAEALHDTRREALAHGAASIPASHMGRFGVAREHAARAVEMAEASQSPGLRIAVRHALGLPPMFRGAFRAAIECYQRDVGVDQAQIEEQVLKPWGSAIVQEAYIRVSYAFSQSNAALCFAELGEFEAARAHAERAVKVAQAVDMLYLRAITQASLGAVLLRQGDVPQALQIAQQWQQSFDQSDPPFLRLAMAWSLAAVLNVSRKVDDSIVLCERAWQLAESKGIWAFAPKVLTTLADAYARVGRDADAIDPAERALHLARQLEQRGDEAYANYTMGQIRVVSKKSESRSWFEQSLAIAQELGMRPLAAACHLALARLDSREGEVQTASKRFASAAEMFRSMGMQPWTAATETALGES